MTAGAVPGSLSGSRIVAPASLNNSTTASYASSSGPCVDSG
jgi:hypothetical protein